MRRAQSLRPTAARLPERIRRRRNHLQEVRRAGSERAASSTAALSSSPERWNPNRDDWDNPAFGARLGYKPNPNWELGASASTGIYLEPGAAPALPAGQSLGDYRQTAWGADLSFAHSASSRKSPQAFSRAAASAKTSM